ncbi:putative methyltransferase-domain-containing protein [Chlamydoabsidia padenii]|nr:putative methyltransferase-domain-containing protein [Chlamydoabsidia padenii]
MNKTDPTILSNNDTLKDQLVDLTLPSAPSFLIRLDEYPSTKATATTTLTNTTTDGDTPTLSSSASSTSSSSLYSSSSPCDDSSSPSAPEVHFYNHLQIQSSLLRIMLKRSLPSQLKAEQWYRLDLQVLDEFGMSFNGQRAKDATMRLACQILEQSKLGGDICGSKDWKVVWRPIRYDAWEWTEETLHMTACSGFDRSGVGGLEFKIQCNTMVKNNNTDINYASIIKKNQLSPLLYLCMVPTFESHQTIHALPLMVGPLTVYNGWSSSPDPTSLLQHPIRSNLPWKSSSSSSQHMYRTFKLDDMDRYFVIQEGWNMGTPGKMWDSALVISDLFVQRIIQQPTCLENCHLLDLSAGTGTAGLLVSFIYQYILPQRKRNIKITLTDLPEALPLIHHNGQINGINTTKHITITPLSWGHTKDIQHIKHNSPPIDIIIASDVLYEPANFSILLQTLVSLAIPRRTVIYLGYKRRGLNRSDEQYFFDLCHDYFDIQAIGYSEDGDGGGEMTIWEKKYGKLVKKRDHMDGQGWLGPFASGDGAHPFFKETGVQIYRLVRKRCGSTRQTLLLG